MPTAENHKITVLHIAGTGRNGSTLMERVFNEVPGFFAAGEVGWGDLFKRNKLCFCGKNFVDCPIWGKIIHDITLQNVNRELLASTNEKYRNVFSLLKLWLTREHQMPADFKQYLQNLERLYHSIHHQTNCQVITDSTASAVYGYYLSLIPTVDFYVVHLVRDPRGFVHSSTQTKLTRRGLLWSKGRFFLWNATTWLKKNLILELLFASRKDKYLRVCYEDFITNPIETLKQVEAMLGLPIATDFVKDNAIKVGTNHLTRGNIDAVKRSEEKVVLKLDNRWKREMKWWKVFLVSMITWPLLLKYYVFSKKS